MKKSSEIETKRVNRKKLCKKTKKKAISVNRNKKSVLSKANVIFRFCSTYSYVYSVLEKMRQQRLR